MFCKDFFKHADDGNSPIALNHSLLTSSSAAVLRSTQTKWKSTTNVVESVLKMTSLNINAQNVTFTSLYNTSEIFL